jgi:ubiquitin C-terminal hydrolase
MPEAPLGLAEFTIKSGERLRWLTVAPEGRTRALQTESFQKMVDRAAVEIVSAPRYLFVRNDLDVQEGEERFKRNVVLDMETERLKLGALLLNGDAEYRLVAFMDHKGAWAKLGHDIAYVRDKDGWIRFDDEEVQECATLRNAVVFGRQYLYLFVRVDRELECE